MDNELKMVFTLTVVASKKVSHHMMKLPQEKTDNLSACESSLICVFCLSESLVSQISRESTDLHDDHHVKIKTPEAKSHP